MTSGGRSGCPPAAAAAAAAAVAAAAAAAAAAAVEGRAKTKVREGVRTLWVNGRVQIISLEEGDRAEAQDVDLHRAEYGTKWMLAQRGE